MSKWLLVLNLVGASWKAELATEEESSTFHRHSPFVKAFSEIRHNLHIMAAIILPENLNDHVSYFFMNFGG